jgi:protein-disulfide isomerase
MKAHPGKVRLVFKDMPLPFHRLARPAHEAARCAGAEGRYWAYHDRLFAEQPDFDRADLIRYAVDLGLEAERFTRCLDSRRHAAAVEADLAQGRALGIRGTPTFLINGRMLAGAQPAEAFLDAIAEALRRR